MSAAHTPGPWTHHADDNIITTHGGRLVLEWQARSNHALSDSMSTEERDANASLIAAAPELLEALEWVVNATDDSAVDRRGVMVDMPSALQRARAAIAKATGEQA